MITNKTMDNQKELFEKIYADYFHRLSAFARSMGANQMEAEDAAHDVLLKLWDERHVIAIEKRSGSYLFVCVRNECIRIYREKKVHEKYAKHFQYENQRDDYDPLMELIDSEMTKKMRTIIEKLPEKCRQAYIMSREENLTYEEIAAKLNISKETVKTHIKRALEKMRIELKKLLV